MEEQISLITPKAPVLRGGFPGSSLGYGFGATGMTPADRSGSVGFSPGVTHATDGTGGRCGVCLVCALRMFAIQA